MECVHRERQRPSMLKGGGPNSAHTASYSLQSSQLLHTCSARSLKHPYNLPTSLYHLQHPAGNAHDLPYKMQVDYTQYSESTQNASS